MRCYYVRVSVCTCHAHPRNDYSLSVTHAAIRFTKVVAMTKCTEALYEYRVYTYKYFMDKMCGFVMMYACLCVCGGGGGREGGLFGR